ncbi:pseudaminic acid synthase [Candidatus Margulisiibacteriota bacterium]
MKTRKPKRIKVGPNRYISESDPTFIVAEMSANHVQDLRVAKKIIREAKKSGADAIKIQTLDPGKITLPSRNKYFRIRHPRWKKMRTLYDLYKKANTPWEWHSELKNLAEDEGLIFFSTPFDKSAVDFLETMDVGLYKIASFELVDHDLIRYVAKTGRPIVMSTGMATMSEIGEAVDAAKGAGAKDIILLKCISSYPADPAEMNLRTIPYLRDKFNLQIGLSDHSLDNAVPIAAVSLGARFIEKHFTLSRKKNSLDSFFSIEPAEMRALVKDIRIVEKAFGTVFSGLTTGEKQSRIFRRSIFAITNIKKGEMFCEDNIGIIRPANGLKPKYIDAVLGKLAKRDIKVGTPLSWSLVKR